LETVAIKVAPVRRAAYEAARQYVAGTEQADAVAVATSLASEDLDASIDLFGENTRSQLTADHEAQRFVQLAAALATVPRTPFLSIDLSHIGLDIDPRRCADRLRGIGERLSAGARLQVGAEDAARTNAVHDVVLRCARDGLPVECTLQANLRRSPQDARRLVAGGVSIRLVKGAYVEAREVAHPWGPATDEAYVGLSALLGELGADYALATHDDGVRARALRDRGTRRVEMLLGVRSDDARRLRSLGHEVRVYVPYGERWFRYWARRVAEGQGA